MSWTSRQITAILIVGIVGVLIPGLQPQLLGALAVEGRLSVAALGGLVIVKHGGGWTSVYGHASKLLVQRGQSVKKGQTIALSGDTGFADRPEVHFELRKGRTPVDPQGQLPRI